jgi:crotonobetainyl-CoA:carnitine CoA-transferase CaiB-like acyl-CoA transferase
MWVTIAVASDEEWRAFSQALGDPPWAKEERFANTLGRWHL